MAKTPEIDNSSINLLGSGTRIKGEIISNGDFRIDGTLQGNISIKGKLVLGTSGKIEGNIACQNADISGIVIGNVKVADLLTLQGASKITGDIHIGKLSIEPGAVFEGKCMMGDSSKEQNRNIEFIPQTESEQIPLSQNQQPHKPNQETTEQQDMQKHRNDKRK